MQSTTLLALLALSATTLAAPTGETGGSCNNNQKQVCCSGKGLISASCVVAGLIPINLLSTTCGGGSYCCTTNSNPAVGTLVNVNALNCVKL